MKRILSVILVLCMVLSVVPTSVFAASTVASGTCGESMTWVLDENGTFVISGTGYMWGYTVSDARPWNDYCNRINSVVIEQGVINIGYHAFDSCNNLTDVSISDSVSRIEGSAFRSCLSLENIDIPDSVTYIDEYAFADCASLTHLDIPNSVTEIDYYAFSGCRSLESITLPSSITQIDHYLFMDCHSLTDIVIPNGVESIGNSAFSFCSSLTNVTIPNSVTSIGADAFAFCSSLTDLVIPDSITHIGGQAFAYCNSLTSVSIPASVTTIDSVPFKDCEKLSGIYVDEANTYYSHDEFGVLFNKNKTILVQAPALTGSYNIPNGVEVINPSAFSRNIDTTVRLNSVIIPDSVTSIGSWAFHNCRYLTDVVLGKGVSSIGEYAFMNCDLKTISIPASVISIGDNAFSGNIWLQGYFVDENNSYYANDAYGVLFNKDKTVVIKTPSQMVGSYTFPSGVTSIYSWAISCCLSSLTIPDGIESLCDAAFDDCPYLEAIYFCGDAPSFGDTAFSGVRISSKVYYPSDNPTWTDEVMQDYGGNITWVPYAPEEPEAPPCSLDELTEEDYLAFASIVYEDFDDYCPDTANNVWHTVQDAMTGMGMWDSADWAEGIIYADLCAHIANWKVMRVINHSYSNGFYSVAFVNDDNEVVIAYRGSEDIKKVTSDFDAFCDWIQNDFPMEVFNTVIAENQYSDAFEMYEDVVTAWNPTQVAVTGHSLGGGLGDMVSARYGCKGVTMNAISVLDAIYDHAPEEMGFTFSGVDEWNFVDHTNALDMIAGMFEYYFSTEMKPYIAHNTNIDVSVTDSEGHLDLRGTVEDILDCHSLHSYVSVGGGETVNLTDVVSNFSPAEVITNQMSFTNRSIDFGTSYNDRIDKGLSVDNARTIYGGGGGDTLIASTLNDTLIGGPIGDDLDGGWGNDKYYYFKGDGVDYIHDADGSDALYLYGFADDDIIEVYEDSDSDYIEVHCNGDIIVKISKKNREYALVALDHFKIILENGEEYDITDAFYKYTSGSHLLITCPVDVLVVDADGNVVYTLEDGVVGSHYTDYGNFYVFEEEDGSYGKVLDLAEGYSVKINGVDSGTMDISVRNVVEGNLSEEEYAVTDIPVSESFVATIEENDEGETILVVDADGDGITDSEYTFKIEGVTRIAGADRIETSLMLADQLKETLGEETFDSIIVASALNFPDALTGSYLAAVKSAPILLTYPAAHGKIMEYIANNLADRGTVYILGGESAVSAGFQSDLAAKGIRVQRLAGSDRFGTNLEIMKEAGVSADQPVLIATGINFADSLSASAAGLPMVLVYGSLRPEQKAFLETTSGNFVIIGGEAAVSASLENELKAIGTVSRLAGNGRYQTSVMVAEEFVPNPDAVVLAYARNFPDGLCGGPLAYALNAPLILTDNYDPSAADAYVDSIAAGIVVGGTGLISDAAARAIFDLAADAPIHRK